MSFEPSASDGYRERPTDGADALDLQFVRTYGAWTAALLWGLAALAPFGWLLAELLRREPYDPTRPLWIAAGLALTAAYLAARALVNHGRVRGDRALIRACRAPLPPRDVLEIPTLSAVRFMAREAPPSWIDRVRARGGDPEHLPWVVEVKLDDGRTGVLPARLARGEARALSRDLAAFVRHVRAAEEEAREPDRPVEDV